MVLLLSNGTITYKGFERLETPERVFKYPLYC